MGGSHSPRFQQESKTKTTLAQQRDILRARAVLEHALAILCGRPAPSFTVAVNPLGEVSPPDVPPGLPAQLLARRPDVAEAEQNLIAANAQIGVATAEFYPRFTLTSSAGFQSADISTVFTWQSRVASILPSVSIPIFEGGAFRPISTRPERVTNRSWPLTRIKCLSPMAMSRTP